MISFCGYYTEFDVLTISVLGSNGNCSILRKSGLLILLFDCKSSADMSREPVSAGLSLETTWWFHALTPVCSKILQTRFAKNIYWTVVELKHCKIVVLLVHIKTLLALTVRARQISCFNRAASSSACNFNFVTVITFVDATRALSRTNASSVWKPLEIVTRARRNATALKTFHELSPNKCNSRCSEFLRQLAPRYSNFRMLG